MGNRRKNGKKSTQRDVITAYFIASHRLLEYDVAHRICTTPWYKDIGNQAGASSVIQGEINFSEADIELLATRCRKFMMSKESVSFPKICKTLVRINPSTKSKANYLKALWNKHVPKQNTLQNKRVGELKAQGVAAFDNSTRLYSQALITDIWFNTFVFHAATDYLSEDIIFLFQKDLAPVWTGVVLLRLERVTRLVVALTRLVIENIPSNVVPEPLRVLLNDYPDEDFEFQQVAEPTSNINFAIKKEADGSHLVYFALDGPKK